MGASARLTDNQARVVSHLYSLCPHCKTLKKEHILHFIKELAKGLVGSDAPEVKFDLTARDPLDLDARLSFSDTFTAHPQLYREFQVV